MAQRGFEIISKHIDNEDYKLPRRKTKNSVAYDYFSPIDTIVPAQGIVKIKTGIKSFFLSDETLLIFTRSSTGTKNGIRLRNSVGVIDSDYYNNPSNEGELIITLHNTSNEDFEIRKGDSIAQGLFQKILLADNEIPPEQTRIGGIGSTGR